jgi:hypothetical protein
MIYCLVAATVCYILSGGSYSVQGGAGIAKKDWGSVFSELAQGTELTRYVIRGISISGKIR